MEELKSKLISLLGRDEWNEEDKQWFLEYLEKTDADELRLLMYEEFGKDDQLAVRLGKDVSADLLSSIHEKIAPTNSKSSNRFFPLWANRVTAAAMIGCCVLGGYLFFQNKKSHDVASGQLTTKSKIYKKSINAAGPNKAMLTLADGTTITLDDAHDGTLARQGATKILKFDGRLAYSGNSGSPGQIMFNTIATPRGGQYQIVLPDGTGVWLNAASSLHFPTSFTGTERRVEVTGEAYFEVSKNAAMPFVVKVNNSEVRVLGTHFNIMAYNEEGHLKTTLLEGSVQFTNGDEKVMLKPGEESELAANGQVKVLQSTNEEDAVAWKNGMFHFYRTDVETMMRQISRWYDVDVVYEGRKTDEKFIADISRSLSLSEALEALEYTGKIKFRMDSNKVFVR